MRGYLRTAIVIGLAVALITFFLRSADPVGVSDTEACGPMPGRPLVRKGGGHGVARLRLRLSRSGWLRER